VDELEPQSFSIIGGIIHLFEGGDILIAAVLMIFSVLFPAAKLGVLYLAILSGSVSSKVVSLLAVIGKWSMLDVFVIALLVVAFKGFPGGSRIELNLGAYFFATSVLLSMFATHAVKARWPGKEAYERPRTTH
jgi:paraquat-inducible protein A